MRAARRDRRVAASVRDEPDERSWQSYLSEILPKLDFDKGNGLVTVVTQHATTGAVLMVAHADREALAETLRTGEMHYRSRTRGLWHKGATSGNTQRIVSFAHDCDGDALIARVIPAGPACHTGADSCFGDPGRPVDVLTHLATTIAMRAEVGPPLTGAAESSYTRRLLADRNLRLKKLGEECAELVTALADADASRATEEAADLFYHMLVALQAAGVTLDDLRAELGRRATK
jgi:phosphoribosyl-ATP pyrophosphohydrolase/phosphoribosyl-AMP cyclohydrolase